MHDSETVTTFASLGLRSALADAVTALGYEEPTPVQREAIPLLLSGRDLLAQAATGTGKTAAFALPMLHRIAESGPVGKRTAGLVLVPTRELAMQVAEAMHRYARGSGLTVVPLYGGAPMHQQIRSLERGAHIVVATPGRALDHVQRGTLVLQSVQVLVLDEADEMLDMGFADDLNELLNRTPDTRQSALFSATMPSRITAIAEQHLKDPARINIVREKPAAGSVPRVRQVAYVVSRAHKPAALARVLDMEDPVATIVFCRTRLEVEELVETINAHGQRAAALHGGLAQKQRDRVMGLLRSQKADLLVATDVAARGLDIEHLTHVVNYDVPASPEVYLHRIGRTGRAGRAGVAITLAEPREHRLLRVIEQYTKSKIEVATIPTVADLRARQYELTSAALREQLVAGKFDQVRVIVESLSDEFDIVDIATAAVNLLHVASAGGGDDREIPAIDMSKRPDRTRDARERGSRPPAGAGAPRLRSTRDQSGEDRGPRGRQHRDTGDRLVRLFIGAGRQAGIRPGDLVGAITGEAGIESRSLGAIEIADRFSLVEVPDSMADAIIDAMRGASLRGKKVQVRRERF
ncbi:MAG: DEAD/DEAH box helicase [Acidobacteria bacterium]|nr:DEAD/DEAH box helicase [Acidobacteriota bacterium]